MNTLAATAMTELFVGTPMHREDVHGNGDVQTPTLAQMMFDSPETKRARGAVPLVDQFGWAGPK